jgi:acyl-coenzyme A synthetase/AMP-(fatty) acid ligase
LSFGALDGARDLLAELPSAVPAPLVDESATSDIAWLAYTGGTTGRSKGVMIPHRSLVTMALVLYADWDWPAEIRFLAATPISHAAGVTLYPIQLRGGFVRLVQGFEVEAYCRAIEQEKITAAFLVPTLAPTTMPRNCRHMSSISAARHGRRSPSTSSTPFRSPGLARSTARRCARRIGKAAAAASPKIVGNLPRLSR